MKHTFIIAEAGVNHNGSLAIAKELIEIAAASGADAVKFQTFQADKLTTHIAPKADYQTLTTGMDESQYEMLKSLELSPQDHFELIKHCKNENILFLSSPFDLESAHLLTTTLDLPMIKIASGEITNAPLLLKIARSGKPVILSTGMSTLGDIEMALAILAFGYQQPHLDPNAHTLMDAYRSTTGQELLEKKVTLLHCTTEYPAPFAEVNLKAMATLKQAFNLTVGYSDHTQGTEIAIAAAALGAAMIEKHVTLDRAMQGPDHQASIEPDELAAMIRAIRHVDLAIGDGQKLPCNAEFKNRLIARKSLVALAPIARGETFTQHNLGLKRPGNGIPPTQYWDWLGKIAEQDYSENEMITI